MGFVNSLPSNQGGVGGNKAICLKASEGGVSQDLDERERVVRRVWAVCHLQFVTRRREKGIGQFIHTQLCRVRFQSNLKVWKAEASRFRNTANGKLMLLIKPG